MNIREFLDSLNSDFSAEKLENNENSIFEYFFYYRRNLREFITAFKTYNQQEQNRIVSFLLHLYPLSDAFLLELFREMKFALTGEISVDTINYLAGAFVEEIGELDLDFAQETKKTFAKIAQISDIVALNQAKLTKLVSTRQELIALKEKDEKLSQEIKILESGDVSSLKNEIVSKSKKKDLLKQEKEELSQQLQKINFLIEELDKYADIREKMAQCREIIQSINFPRDYSDKL